MSALEYILSNYQKPSVQKLFSERSVLRALVHTLSKNELKQLEKEFKRGGSKWKIENDLCREIAKALKKHLPRKVESTSALLRLYTDKKSGRVTYARKELKKRFETQPYKVQKQILKAFLYGSRDDRIRTFWYLRKHWDNYFYEDVKYLWELYHEEDCQLVIIKHFPMEYVYDNLKYLDSRDNYTHLCIKLIHHPLFHIDKSRFSFLFDNNADVEYLFILALSNSQCEKGMATRILYEQIVEYINNQQTSPIPKSNSQQPWYFSKDESPFWYFSMDGNLSTKHFHVVSRILWCMGRLGLAEELIDYAMWDDLVQRKIIQNMYEDNDSPDEYWDLFRMTIAECLPDEYKSKVHFPLNQTSNKEQIMIEIKNNHILNDLINTFDLEIE